MEGVSLRPYRPGDAGWITRQHGHLYAREEGFDGSFAPMVAGILRDFESNHDPDCERGWVAVRDARRLGCIFCVRDAPGMARLRLFLVVPRARNTGLGRRLLQTCTGFARAAGYDRMRLWTHESHRAACRLYRRTGWRLMTSVPVRAFGIDLVEQSWEIDL
ncbi:GNAT family N-acetyltransferase [Roseovarius salinarum]|uniref:GNAT family N-acetyltransferase n=1 Tax=Roseovarius salinarum TaxID=1981892 RepID=UPI000C3475D4|nr:GNAT family N-acetyltransferase [Roseovarius salinarum]